MATREEIKKALLKVAGDPVSGVVRDLVDEMADAVVALDVVEAKQFKPVAETRVTAPREVR